MPKTPEQRERSRQRRLARKAGASSTPEAQKPKSSKIVGTWNGTTYREGDDVAPWVTLSGGPVPLQMYDPDSPYSHYSTARNSLNWVKASVGDMNDLLEDLTLRKSVAMDGGDNYNLAKARCLLEEVERILRRTQSRHDR